MTLSFPALKPFSFLSTDTNANHTDTPHADAVVDARSEEERNCLRCYVQQLRQARQLVAGRQQEDMFAWRFGTVLVPGEDIEVDSTTQQHLHLGHTTTGLGGSPRQRPTRVFTRFLSVAGWSLARVSAPGVGRAMPAPSIFHQD